MSEVEGQLALLQETRSYGPITVTFNRFGRELEATINVPEGYTANITVRADVFRLGLPPRETKTVTYSFGPGTHTIVLSASELGGLFGRFEVVASPQHVGPGKEEEYLKEITKAFQEQTKAITEAIKSMQESISSMQESISQQIQYLAQLMQAGQQPSPEETEAIEKLMEQYTESMRAIQQQIAMLQEEILRLEQQPKTPEQSKEVEELRKQIQQYQQQIAQLQEQIRKLQEELSKAKAPRPQPVTPPKPISPPTAKEKQPPKGRPPITVPPVSPIRGKLEVRGTATNTKYPDKLPGTFYAKGWVKVINPNNMSKTFRFSPFAKATVSTGSGEVTWVNVGRNYRIYVNGKFVGSEYTDTIPAKSEKQYTVELYVDIPFNEAMKSLQYGISVDYQYEYWDEHEHRWRKKWDHLIAWAVYVTESELRQIIKKSKAKKVTATTTTRKVTKTGKVPAKIVIKKAPSSVEVFSGQPISVTVELGNIGGEEARGLVVLLDEHGYSAAVKSYTLAPGESTKVVLTASAPLVPGKYRWQIVVTDVTAKKVFARKLLKVNVKPGYKVTPIAEKKKREERKHKIVVPKMGINISCEVLSIDVTNRKAVVRLCNKTKTEATYTIHIKLVKPSIPGGGPKPPRPTTPVLARVFGRIVANLFAAVTTTDYGSTSKEYGPIPPNKCRDITISLPIKVPGKYLLVIHGRANGQECEVRREFEIKPTKVVVPKPRPKPQPVPTPTLPPPAGPRKEKGAAGELSCNITSYNSHVRLEVKNTTLIGADVKYEVYKDNNRIYRGYATAPATNIWSETIDLRSIAKNAGLTDVYGKYRVVVEASNSLKQCTASKIVEVKKSVVGGGPRPVPTPGGALMTQKGGETRARKGHLY